MKVICTDNCKKEFELNGFQAKRVKGDIEKTFFTCTHCNHEYVSFYTNTLIRKMQIKIQELMSKNAATYVIEQKRKEIAKHMKELREKVEVNR